MRQPVSSWPKKCPRGDRICGNGLARANKDILYIQYVFKRNLSRRFTRVKNSSPNRFSDEEQAPEK